MGFVEDIQALELSDEVKETLIKTHQGEVDPLREQNDTLSAQARKSEVEAEVAELSGAGFSESPGLLKFYRRVLLSRDAEEPGAVLLSDSDLNLSGDEATGSRVREEISVAGALREFVKLMPRNDEGKISIALSEQGSIAGVGNPPASGEEDSEEEKAEARTKRTNRLAGEQVKRTRKRYGKSALVSE